MEKITGIQDDAVGFAMLGKIDPHDTAACHLRGLIDQTFNPGQVVHIMVSLALV